MKQGWDIVKLGQFATVRTGKLNSNAAIEDGKYPFFTCSEFPLKIDIPAYEGECVFVAGNCTPYVNYYKGKFNAYQRTYFIESNDQNELNTRWLYFWMKTYVKYLLSGQRGSVERYLVLGDFTDALIQRPPLPVQKKIAAVLGALDDKIELNRKMNKNLEEQAQALFKSWFVDFEPWGGKMPKEWKKINLTEIADFYHGYSYTSKELQPSKTAMVTIKNFERRGGFKLDGFKEIVPSAKLKDTQHVEVFDTLVAHTDMTQNADVIGNAEIMLSKAGYDDIVASTDLAKVVPKGGISKFLIAALLKNQFFKKHCLGYVNGTTVLHMSKSALPSYELCFPKEIAVLNEVSLLFEQLYRRMASNIDESRKLAEMRDALLPKLMSGEIEV